MTIDRPLGAPIIRMGIVTSTMDIARRLETLGAPEGTTSIAGAQTRGRGRADRVWQSPPNAGFYCSILLRPNVQSDQFQPFSVAVALAVCEAIDPHYAIGLQFKWPNDVLYRDRKLAGILITTSLTGSRVSSAIAGIGLNVLHDQNRPATAISLAEIESLPTTRISDLRSTILSSISKRYSDICADRASAISDWPSRLAYLGLQVELLDGGTVRTGTVRGLDPTGALILSTTNGHEHIGSGELTRGPRPHTET